MRDTPAIQPVQDIVPEQIELAIVQNAGTNACAANVTTNAAERP